MFTYISIQDKPYCFRIHTRWLMTFKGIHKKITPLEMMSYKECGTKER